MAEVTLLMDALRARDFTSVRLLCFWWEISADAVAGRVREVPEDEEGFCGGKVHQVWQLVSYVSDRKINAAYLRPLSFAFP